MPYAMRKIEDFEPAVSQQGGKEMGRLGSWRFRG